jgi:transcriptional regulator GlxA family with amidase domain
LIRDVQTLQARDVGADPGEALPANSGRSGRSARRESGQPAKSGAVVHATRDELPTRRGTTVLQWGSKPLRVGFVLAKDFTLSAFADFIDTLRLAADDADKSRPIRCQWHVMSSSDHPVRSSCGLFVCPTARLIDPLDLDYIVVVGGLLHRPFPLDKATADYLARAGRTGVKLAGICTGSFVLCRLGLLDGKKCCISWFHYRDFIEEFVDLVPVADQLYVIDGNRITCSGGTGVVFLAADLIRRHLGTSTAQKVLHMQQIDRLKPGSSVQAAPPFGAAGDDDRISRALLLMEQNLARPVPISKIASSLATSPRQLERLFKEIAGCGPQAAYLQLRLKHARWMLNSKLSLTCIAAETGFADGAHFGKMFKATYGINPSEERRRMLQEGGQLGEASNGGDAARRVFDPVAVPDDRLLER